jgi:hypothetical protein
MVFIRVGALVVSNDAFHHILRKEVIVGGRILDSVDLYGIDDPKARFSSGMPGPTTAYVTQLVRLGASDRARLATSRLGRVVIFVRTSV